MSSWFLASVIYFIDFSFWLIPYYIPISLLTTTIIAYGLLFPIDWTKDLTDVGYNYVGSKRTINKRIERIKKAKKVGKLPPVYPNGWFMLGESEDVYPGTVKHIQALGENFAVCRTLEGNIFILDAYCPHNGANMAIGGKVIGDCLECPFHQWSFKGDDGSCFNVPYAKKVPPFARVKHWDSCEVNGFIFVWYHAENESPSWFLYNNEEILTKSYKYHGRNEFIINCHIQDVPENGGDLSHFNAIHCEAMMNGSDLSAKKSVLFKSLRHKWTAQWEAGKKDGEKHIGYCKLTHAMILFGKFSVSSCDVAVRQIGPGYVELIIVASCGPVVLLQTVTPIEPLLQKVVHRIYCPPPLRIYASFVLLGESIMIERDIMVWNHKTYVDNPLLVSEDQTLAKHRRWFSQFYSEKSPRYEFVRDTKDW